MSPAIYRHDRPHLPRGSGGAGRNLPEVEITILRGRAQNLVRPVTLPAFLIGGATDCDLVLGDSRFPDAHSYLLLSPSEVGVRWLGFGPQVSVNGELIEKARLADGDCLRMGPYEFRVSIRVRDTKYDAAEPRILRLNAVPPDDLDAANHEIRGLLAEILEAMEPAAIQTQATSLTTRHAG